MIATTSCGARNEHLNYVQSKAIRLCILSNRSFVHPVYFWTAVAEEGEKEPVIFAVRSEAKLSPETSGKGLFFSRSERQSRKRSSARRPGLQRPFGHVHRSGPAPLPSGHCHPPTSQGLPGVFGPHDDHPPGVQPPHLGLRCPAHPPARPNRPVPKAGHPPPSRVGCIGGLP